MLNKKSILYEQSDIKIKTTTTNAKIKDGRSNLFDKIFEPFKGTTVDGSITSSESCLRYCLLTDGEEETRIHGLSKSY